MATMTFTTDENLKVAFAGRKPGIPKVLAFGEAGRAGPAAEHRAALPHDGGGPSASTRGAPEGARGRRQQRGEPAGGDRGRRTSSRRCIRDAGAGPDGRAQGEADVQLCVQAEAVHARIYAPGAGGAQAGRTW